MRVALPFVHRDRDDSRAARIYLTADRDALVHERRQRDVPAFAGVAEAFGVGDANIGHVDLVEFGLARRLHERSHLDARCLHVEDEHRHPLVLDLFGIGAHEDDAEPREVRERRPHLLAVDDPLVAVAHGARAETGDVGAGSRLAEHLAPDLFAGEQWPQVALLLRIGAVGHDRRRAHAVSDRIATVRNRRTPPEQLAVDRVLQQRL